VLTGDDILHALGALADELQAQGQQAQLVVMGGAALVLLYDARESTKDVDACILKPDAASVRAAAARVAEALDLPADWLNDAAKGYLVGVTAGPTVFNRPSLVVRTLSTEQLLAMKLGAWRDAIDREDAQLLLSKLSGTKEEVWKNVQPLVPPEGQHKACYAFEDLWEVVHGTP
jgi:hypothetical protein